MKDERLSETVIEDGQSDQVSTCMSIFMYKSQTVKNSRIFV